MKVEAKGIVKVGLIATLLASCGTNPTSNVSQDNNKATQEEDVTGDVDTNQAVTSIERRHVVDVNFSKWVNFVRIDVGVSTSLGEDQVCRFVMPIKNDMTTSWKPFQIYWVFKEQINGLTRSMDDVFEIGDTYAIGDLVKDGIYAKGFRELTNLNRKFFSITGIKVNESSNEISGNLEIPSSSIIKRFVVHAKPKDGGCEVVTTTTNRKKIVNSYYVSQNFMGMAKAVYER